MMKDQRLLLFSVGVSCMVLALTGNVSDYWIPMGAGFIAIAVFHRGRKK